MDIFKVDTIENSGDNWLIADFGVDQDGKHYILTTNQVHASELHQYSGGAKADAELVCKLLNGGYDVEQLRQCNIELRAKLEDLHSRYTDLFITHFLEAAHRRMIAESDKEA